MTTYDAPLYLELPQYAAIRSNELAPMLAPYTELTDRYAEVLCRIVAALGKKPPTSMRDVAVRDLIADVFDFPYEARPLIAKGMVDVAYPLARRAFESLSLLVACSLEPKLADRWIAGKEVRQSEVRRVLADHPKGEKEARTRELYDFFSRTTHPNRDYMAHRLLGQGNEFVLGAVGKPSLVILADYALKSLGLWFWFAAFVGFTYRELLSEVDPNVLKIYLDTAKDAEPTATWLREQYNRLLVEEQDEMRRSGLD
jgi:hypothetical protein